MFLEIHPPLIVYHPCLCCPECEHNALITMCFLRFIHPSLICCIRRIQSKLFFSSSSGFCLFVFFCPSPSEVKKNFCKGRFSETASQNFLNILGGYNLRVMCSKFLRIRSKVKVKVTPHTQTQKKHFLGHNSK